MPFTKMPPETIIDAFVADLERQKITVSRSTLERDLDRIMFAVTSQKSLDAQAQALLEKLPQSARAAFQDLNKPLSPEVAAICEAVRRHFSGYFE